jgi:hypothetical protein
MIIEKQPVVDFEPYTFRLYPKEALQLMAKEIEESINEWLSARDIHPICNNRCIRKFLEVSDEPSTGGVIVSIQWLCETCAELLFEKLESQFPSIVRIVVGYPATIIQARGEIFLAIPQRVVTLESSQALTVPSFKISTKPIDVAQMREFCRKTGYRTSAEIVGGMQANFKNNPFVSIIPSDQRNQFEALFLSYNDALAYCGWARVRLPTEGEYLAASLADDEIHEGASLEKIMQESAQKIVSFVGLVITATLEGEVVVFRGGPKITKTPGWANKKSNRRLFAKDKPAGVLYVCS